MKKIIQLMLFSVALLFSQLNYSQVERPVSPENRTTLEDILIPNEVIVRLQKGANAQRVVDQMPANYEFQIERLLSAPTDIWLFTFNDEVTNVNQIIRDLKNLNDVFQAQVNTLVDLREAPNDPLYGSQWQHQNINSEEAWDISTGGTSATGEDIVVCIIESANVMGHPDLVGNHWTNTAEVADGTDTDGNGYIDDINGWNVSTNNDNIGTGNHGTSVAGMIGAVGNNGLGVAGANWDVKMMVVAGYNQPFTQANIVEAYTYPLQARILWNNTNGAEGAFVVATNASWGVDFGDPNDYPIWCGFYDDLGQAGIINCGATTNQNVNVDVVGDVPTACASDYMVGVAATNISDISASGYGPNTINVAAPGTGIFTTNNGGYGTTSGTSFASPLTAGVIGLMYSIPCESFMTLVKDDPQGAADIVMQALYDGVDQSAHLMTRVITGGRINSKNAIDILMDAVCVVNDDDVGVIEINQPEDGLLSENETIEITIRNFGVNTQSNFDVTYQIDGGTVITETFTGSIESATNETFTFSTTADLSIVGETYSITASTALTTDEDTNNDSFTKEVTHLFPDDIGVTDLLEPVSGDGLSNAEAITIEITNFGGASQSNFDVSYSIDGGAAVTETVAGPLGVGETIEYTFTQTADFSVLGDYIVMATTMLSGDSDPDNDALVITITHEICQPESNCNSGDGLTRFILEEINLPNISCTGNGYMDMTEHAATLDAEVGEYTATIRSGFANQQFSGWIDYNDNGVFEPSEQIFSNVAVATANTDVNVPFTIPSDAFNGDHLMRVRGKWGSGSGDLNDPCADLQWGNTVDFTATIINGTLSTNDFGLNDSDFVIVSQGDNQFQAILTTTNFDNQDVKLSVYNVLGQRVHFSELENNDGVYTYVFNMNSNASGVYLVRAGTSSKGKVKRIIVK
ncbi:MAG: S8 family serine peptidase [Flavobacteriaceae bacterium]|nr:S8 family serine peptidase [Flavobacteriaceae bacterium]